MRILPRRRPSNRGFVHRPRQSAFTLIELLTVIAIIGILAAIVIPTVGTVREKAERAVDSNKLREILKAATIYAGDNQDRLPDPQPSSIPNNVLNAPQLDWKWPGILAKNKILDDPLFWFCKNDPAYNSAQPPQFIIQPNAQRNSLHTSFTSGGRSPSWGFVGGIKMSDPATTPVLFTRGLMTSGAWSATSGVYKDTGGFVAYLGGNVAFYPRIENTQSNPSPFVSNNPNSTSTQRPINILQAIPFNTSNANLSSRIYAIPPTSGAGGMVGAANGTIATRGP